MSDKLDIVERLGDAFVRNAVCHCGSGMGCCDNHDFSWNPDEDTEMLSDARHEITTLRKQLKVATKALNKVHKWQRGEGLLVSVAAAMSDVLADPALAAMVKGEA